MPPGARAELLSVCSPNKMLPPYDHLKDPRFTQPPREPNWRKVILVLATTAILVVLALAVGAVIQ